MYREIENPMVLDSHWRHQEKEPQVVGECAGCEEDIVAGEDFYELQIIAGEKFYIHQNDECCRQYVAEYSICRGGKEE